MRLSAILALFATIGMSWASSSYSQISQGSFCRPVAKFNNGILPANYEGALHFAQARQGVEITYLAHSSFRIENSSGLNIATDYTGFHGSKQLPDIATMNTVHDGHFTFEPDEEIEHVLRGWRIDGEAVRHYVRINDTIVRNITTDFTSQGTGYRPDENSIFIFETDGLCIGHLGQLHEYPTEEQLAEIGRLDVMMMPVNGIQTLSLDNMERLIKRLGVRIILPMHWHDKRSLLGYLEQIEGRYPTDKRNDNSINISIESLPSEPRMIFLTPETSFRLFDE
ncbi:MAG: MBL fold metallo-hydrolase [Hyphomicrobiales bacterium]